MKYAPVLIPTLCRYEHFIKCLCSLEQCTYAEFTDVYIALDYPKTDNHRDGYEKIKLFLHNYINRNPFKTFNIIEREYNYGVGKNGNAKKASSMLFEKYDSIITSEDDNIFSPNFLVYMNKGLQQFKDDNSILAINGYRHPYGFKFGENNYFRHTTDFSAWGIGLWRDKCIEYISEIENNIFKKTFSLPNLLKVRKSGLNRLYSYIFLVFKKGNNIWITDSVLSNYMIIKNKTVIMPSVSKVRNIGWDKTGQSFNNGVPSNCRKIAQRHNNQDIDSDDDFDFKGDPWTFFDVNNKIARRESDGRINIIQFFYKLIVSFFHYMKNS